MVIGSIVAEVHAQPPETRANVMAVDHGDQTIQATSTFAPETTLAVFIVNPPTSCSARRGSVSAVPIANRNVVSCRSGEPMRKPSIHLIQLHRGRGCWFSNLESSVETKARDNAARERGPSGHCRSKTSTDSGSGGVPLRRLLERASACQTRWCRRRE